MAADERERLQAALKALPVAALLTDLRARTFLLVNDRAAEEFGTPAGQLVGDDVLSVIHPDDRDAAIRAYDALESGAIDGYQVHRRIVLPDGRERVVGISGRRIEAPGGPVGLWIVTPEPAQGTFDTADVRPADLVLALTDHDWQLQYVNADAELLGGSGDDLRGTPLLGFVHPSVATEFLEAATRAVANKMAVTFRTRLRAGPDRWADRYVLLVPMCEHNPPRLGVVVTAAPLDETPVGLGLQPHVHRSAVEARATRALRALPRLTGLPGAAGLSARQVEIISRLIEGEHVDQIAQSLFLSPSTVRNHLTAIYRKFGVHSQAELLAFLLRATNADP
jgi:PAS domain S-box-containing protein